MRFFRLLGSSILAVVILGNMATLASAQKPFSNVTPQRPQLSPYLNLLNQNVPGVSNYFTLVRPQLDQQANLRRQEDQIRQLQRAQQVNNRSPLSARGSNDIRATGHDTQFMYFSHYFNQLNRGR
ncbi:MAG: hypothetical protein SFX18_18585 [Pirellulales bacterium]|nr:hypothetical protein [Pirellulales bacterium]